MNTLNTLNTYRVRLNQDTLKIPNGLFQGGERQRTGRSMAILMNLIYEYGELPRRERVSNKIAQVSIPLSGLQARTGYKKTQVYAAIKELESEFVQTIKNPRENQGSSYVFLDPKTKRPLHSCVIDSERVIERDGPHVMANNRVQYFLFPTCLLTSTEHWALRKMTSSEVELYVALWWTANHADNKSKNTAWHGKVPSLRKAAKLVPTTFETAMQGLVTTGLVQYSEIPSKPGHGATYSIELLNPYTGSAFAGPDTADEDDDENYVVQTATGQKRFRANPNPSEGAHTKKLLEEWGYTGAIRDGANNWVMICCPFHDDHNPSCGVTPWGFNCLSCEAQGSLRQLAQKFGKVVFSSPLDEAIEKYLHKDAQGYTLYRFARYPDRDGDRVYRYERKVNGKWNRLYKGRKILYNLDLLQTTVILTEGCKDADTATNLNFTDERGNAIVGTTSGGNGSWQHKFAKQFAGCRVILIPDTDAAGELYRKAVKESFDAEGVEYIEVLLNGAKDLTEYRARPEYSDEELARLIGHGWIGGTPGNQHVNFGGATYYDETVEV
jgi:hypothetical protein